MGDCGCNSEDYDYAKLATTQPCSSVDTDTGNCVSNEGKFYDKTTEQFVVPLIGKEAYIHLCNAKLWALGQWIGINLPNNKYAIFKITEVGTQRIKVLNGLDKSGVAGIIGNPVAGTIIASGSVLYAVIPSGSDSEFVTKVISAIENSGVETVINILKESESICFTNIPSLSDEDGDGHLFAGTKPDCDCEEGASVLSCFRKILKIVTGQSGKTLCFPEVATTSDSPVDGISKRVAYFDENKCLKRGMTIEDLNSCAGISALGNDIQFDGITGCKDGVKKTIVARKNYEIKAVPVDPLLPDGDYKWQVKKSGLQFYPLTTPQVIAIATGTSTVTFAEYPHTNCYGVFDFQSVLGGATFRSIKITVNGVVLLEEESTNIAGGGWNSQRILLLPLGTATIVITTTVYTTGSDFVSFSLKLIGYKAFNSGV